MQQKRFFLWGVLALIATAGIIALMIASGVVGYFWGFSKGMVQGNQLALQAGPAVAEHKGIDAKPPYAPLKNLPIEKLKREVMPILPPALREKVAGLEGSVSIEQNLSQLEKTINQILPHADPQDLTPPEAVYAAVRVGEDDSNEAVKNYLARVRDLFNAEGHHSLVSMTQSMSAPDEKSIGASLSELEKSFEEMKKMSVPPRCRHLHARYLFLVPELISLFQASKAANEEGDTGLLIEALSKGRKIIALQRDIQKLEKELEQTLKG